MWLQEPGSFTRIIAAMVAPRKTSSETMRAGRAGLTAAMEFEAGATIVSAVAMGRPSNGGDSTAAQEMPQRCGIAVFALELLKRICISGGRGLSPDVRGRTFGGFSH
jgi:hypothetical protein